MAHVAVLDEAGQPFVVPVAYARAGDDVVFHGSTASRLFRSLSAGANTCLTVTLYDGLVLARSTFESSMHYRSAMVLGRAQPLEGSAKLDAMQAVTEHLMPGRWAEARHPSSKELAATLVLRLSLTEWSVKVSDGWPEDLEEDLAMDVWAGVVPVRETYGAPRAAPDLRPGTAVPGYVRDWAADAGS